MSAPDQRLIFAGPILDASQGGNRGSDEILMSSQKPVPPCMTENSWHPITTAPFDCSLELAVVEGGDVHALVFRCRRVRDGWVNAATGQRLAVDPTHWRKWEDYNPR
jgi:hypothetical protein